MDDLKKRIEDIYYEQRIHTAFCIASLVVDLVILLLLGIHVFY